jgi:tRNA dimethylallyltransferase
MTAMSPVVVLGPTASGKSDVAMAAAMALGNVHIVAADAMQVYRRMNIGTAKPTVEDQQRVIHHGLDLADPHERYTVARYVQDREIARTQIAEAGARELVVGGTGLYVTAVVDGLNLPGEWPEVRAELETEPDTAVLFRRLQSLDAVATTKMEPTNRRRIIRALEVCVGSGQPFSSFGEGVTTFPVTDIVQVGIRWERNVLRARIAQRVHRMVDAGLFEEVRALLEIEPAMSLTARQALGYKEVIECLEGRWTQREAIEATILRTQQFAIRQERWYRRDPRIQWVEVRKDPIAEVTPVVVAALT